MVFLAIESIVTSFVWVMGFVLKKEMDISVIKSNWITPISLRIQLISRFILSLIIITANSLTTVFFIWLLFGFNIRTRIFF